MEGAARLADDAECNTCQAVGPAVRASPDVHTNGTGSVHMGSRGVYPACCDHGSTVAWIAAEGAATVWINREPASGSTHTTTHPGGTGRVIGASGDVFIGGPSITMQELARADALGMIEKAKRSLDRWNDEDKKHFKTWFGSDDEAARSLMQARLIRMSEKLRREDFAQTDEDSFAHVNSAGNTVNLDKLFWTSPREGEDSRAGTVVHETSHFDSTGSTEDHEYGSEKCLALAKDSPSKAINNADSNEYWMEHMP